MVTMKLAVTAALILYGTPFVVLGTEDDPTADATPAAAATSTGRPLTRQELDSLEAMPVEEATKFLRDRAAEQTGTAYARSLLVAAALKEAAYLNAGTDSLKQMRNWLTANAPDSIEAELITTLDSSGVPRRKRLAAALSAIQHFESNSDAAATDPIELYEHALGEGVPEIGILNFLRLKQIQLLMEGDDTAGAAAAIDKIGTRQLPEHYDDFLKSVRLELELRENDQALFRER